METKALAPWGGEGMRHLLGVRIHSVPPCCLPQMENVKCGYSDQLALGPGIEGGTRKQDFQS